jgi:hypothetical protein
LSETDCNRGLSLAAETDEASIVARSVEQLRQGLLKADRAALEGLCAAELSYGHSGGTLETKAEFVEANANGFATWKSLEFNDQLRGSHRAGAPSHGRRDRA